MSYLTKEQVRTIINNAPQGTSPAGIVASLRSKGHQLEGYEDVMKNTLTQPEQPKPTEQPEQGLGGKLLERGKNIVGELTPKKETSTYEKISGALGGKTLRVAGQAAGAIGDVIGAGLEKGYETLVPEKAKETIKNVGVEILKTPLGQSGIEAIQGGVEKYGQWKQSNPEAAKDLESVVNIAALLPVGKGVGVAGKAAAEATVGARKSVAKTIIGSAEKNVSEALAPTTKEAKLLTEKITPEFMKKGIVGSRETILKKAEEGVADFGKQIESYISSGKLKGEVPKRKITDAIDEFSRGGMTEGGIVLDSEKVELAEKMRGMISQFGDNIPAEEAKSALRVLGEMTARKKGFTTGGEKLAAQLERDIYGSIAGELAKANPSLDKLNKSFAFYKNLAQVTSETITRTKPQSGMFRKAAATLFAGQGQGVFDTAIKYLGSKLFLDFFTSSAWKTTNAKVKNSLAKAIYSGDTKGADGIIEAAKKGFNSTILDKTSAGMSVKDVSKVDGRDIPTILSKIDKEDGKLMEEFIDNVRLKKGNNVDLEIKARKMAESMGLNPDVSNSNLANKFDQIMSFSFPKKTILDKTKKQSK